jgi:hypothetical protein
VVKPCEKNYWEDSGRHTSQIRMGSMTLGEYLKR